MSCRIGIFGGGAWGVALARAWCEPAQEVSIWARRPERRRELRRGSPIDGGEKPLPECIEVCESVPALVDGIDVLVLATPSATVAEVLGKVVTPLAEQQTPVVLLAKGLEEGRGRRLSEVAAEFVEPARVFVLLGPSHAEEVAVGMPTAIVLAGGDPDRRRELQASFSTSTLRVYTNDDLAGVEYAAALKNVLAIAAGICDGLGLGDNTKGALLTRGIAEIARLGAELGGRRETFFGLSGVGDVITTCLSRHSRNRAFGEAIGRGASVDDALASVGQVVEGLGTTRTVQELAVSREVPVPITHEVHRVLFQGKAPRQAIEDLMLRELKEEWDDRDAASVKEANEDG